MRNAGVAAALVLAAALAACGGDASGSRGGLSGCLSSWNAERAGSTGLHVYGGHGATEALVTIMEAGGADSCAVVFAVPPSDSEFGTVGEIATVRGWVPMQTQVRDAAALQRRGAAEANAALRADGTLELR